MMPKTMVAAVGAMLLTSCLKKQAPSLPAGHFENMTEAEAEALMAEGPTVLAENAATAMVAISGELLLSGVGGFGRSDLALQILETGVELAVFLPPETQDVFADARFAEFANAARQYQGRIRSLPSTGYMPGVWARDWAPLQAVTPKGRQILLDFNYYPDRPTGDITPQTMAKASDKHARLSIPVYNEGGNFMSNSRGVCMMTSRVVDANQDQSMEVYVDKDGKIMRGDDGFVLSNLSDDKRRDPLGRRIKGNLFRAISGETKVRTDDRVLSVDDIKHYYQKYAGCKEVHVFPRMPEEGTGHIDMWAKFLSDDLILVNELSELQLKLPMAEAERDYAKIVKTYLDNMATKISGMGFQVVRIPMPLPQNRSWSEAASESTYHVVRSYSNSLLINRSGRQTAIVPRYEKARLTPGEVSGRGLSAEIQDYSDSDAIKDYEAAVEKAYNAAGYQVSWINADQLIAAGGAVHCVTMQFAFPL